MHLRIVMCEEIPYDLMKCCTLFFRQFATKKFREVGLTYVLSAHKNERKITEMVWSFLSAF